MDHIIANADDRLILRVLGGILDDILTATEWRLSSVIGLRWAKTGVAKAIRKGADVVRTCGLSTLVPVLDKSARLACVVEYGAAWIDPAPKVQLALVVARAFL